MGQNPQLADLLNSILDTFACSASIHIKEIDSPVTFPVYASKGHSLTVFVHVEAEANTSPLLLANQLKDATDM